MSEYKSMCEKYKKIEREWEIERENLSKQIIVNKKETQMCKENEMKIRNNNIELQKINSHLQTIVKDTNQTIRENCDCNDQFIQELLFNLENKIQNYQKYLPYYAQELEARYYFCTFFFAFFACVYVCLWL